jgi:glutaredoxin 3
MARVVIYTTSYCERCAAAKDLLRSRRVYFEEVDCTGDLELRDELAVRCGGRMTVPQIWIGERHIGGYQDLVRLDEQGELGRLLQFADGAQMPMQMG